MQDNSPLVSIVIPTYNGGKTIKRTIESVLVQSYTNFELFILNNCSTDDTLEILSSFDDERINIVNNEENIGFEGNWNKALKYINGKYFKLLPDDDLLFKNSLKKSVAVLESNANVVLVSSKREIINENDKKIMVRGKSLGNKSFCTYGEVIKYITRYASNPIGEPGAVLFRSNSITDEIKFDMSIPYFIDLDFYLKVLQKGDFYFIDDVLYSFRVWSRSYSVENQNKQLEETKEFFRKVFLKNDNLGNTDKILYYFNLYKTYVLKYIFYKVINIGK